MSDNKRENEEIDDHPAKHAKKDEVPEEIVEPEETPAPPKVYARTLIFYSNEDAGLHSLTKDAPLTAAERKWLTAVQNQKEDEMYDLYFSSLIEGWRERDFTEAEFKEEVDDFIKTKNIDESFRALAEELKKEANLWKSIDNQQEINAFLAKGNVYVLAGYTWA